jgi:hypothetical protein
MKLNAKQLEENWSSLMGYIDTYIDSPRKEKLKEFYEKHKSRLILYPASHKKEYHNAFPGGYVEHVLRVIEGSLRTLKLWESMKADISGFTKEELVFSALNHDLGKMGDEDHEAYIPQDNKWRKDNLGEIYKFNDSLAFASVPDRSLFLLQSNGISYSFNEMVAIQTHDGLYDEANKKYLLTYMPETKLRTSMPIILHQADMMAARIEFEREWLGKFGGNVKNSGEPSKNGSILSNNKKQPTKNKALNNIKSEGLKNMLNDL